MTELDKNDLSPRHFAALLKGIVKLDIVKDDSITREDIVQQVFAESKMESESINELMKRVSDFLKQAAYESMQPNELKDLLEKQSGLSDEQQKVFVKFWMKEREPIHLHMVKQSAFEPKIGQMKWRVDQLTNIKDLSEATQIASIIELTKKTNGSKDEKVIFEVDKETLFSVLSQLQEIQNKISTLST